jgi:hypothetical protein
MTEKRTVAINSHRSLAAAGKITHEQSNPRLDSYRDGVGDEAVRLAGKPRAKPLKRGAPDAALGSMRDRFHGGRGKGKDAMGNK